MSKLKDLFEVPLSKEEWIQLELPFEKEVICNKCKIKNPYLSKENVKLPYICILCR